MITVGGLLPFTMIDYPGQLAAIVFCQGCLLRCPYCHNPELQTPAVKTDVTWPDVVSLLESRKKLLDGVVFSGGEPLIQPDLKEAIEQVKKMGFKVALHTSGALVDNFREVLPLLDWVGLDVKAPFNKEKYARASGTQVSADIADKTAQVLDMILAAHVPFEVRTTADPRVVSKEDILALATDLSKRGVRCYALQEYRPIKNGVLEEPTEMEIKSFYMDKDYLLKLGALFDSFTVRRA